MSGLVEVDSDVAAEIQREYHESRALVQDAANAAIRCGNLLAAQKLALTVGHGHFQDWVATNLTFSYETAKVYMRLAEKSKKVAPLPFSSIRAFLASRIDKPAESELAKAAKPRKAPTSKLAVELQDSQKEVTRLEDSANQLEQDNNRLLEENERLRTDLAIANITIDSLRKQLAALENPAVAPAPAKKPKKARTEPTQRTMKNGTGGVETTRDKKTGALVSGFSRRTDGTVHPLINGAFEPVPLTPERITDPSVVAEQPMTRRNAAESVVAVNRDLTAEGIAATFRDAP